MNDATKTFKERLIYNLQRFGLILLISSCFEIFMDNIAVDRVVINNVLFWLIFSFHSALIEHLIFKYIKGTHPLDELTRIVCMLLGWLLPFVIVVFIATHVRAVNTTTDTTTVAEQSVDQVEEEINDK